MFEAGSKLNFQKYSTSSDLVYSIKFIFTAPLYCIMFYTISDWPWSCEMHRLNSTSMSVNKAE